MGELQLLKNFRSFQDNWESLVIFSKGCNVQDLETNKYLIIISEYLLQTVSYAKEDTKFFMVYSNSVILLQDNCSSFISNT